MNKLFSILISTLAILLFSSTSLFAASEFTLRPGNGAIKSGTKFTVDILIDTVGAEVLYARSVLTFDPDLVRVVKAERNDSLFCDYPEDDQSVDNTNGVIMLTGFCQSGSGVLYKTEGDPDVFERIEFEAEKAGELILAFEYSGEDEPFKSVILNDGSPPTNSLTEAPIDGKYTIVQTLVVPTQTPGTGYSISIGMVISGILLLLCGLLFIQYRAAILPDQNKGKTVVLYNEKK